MLCAIPLVDDGCDVRERSFRCGIRETTVKNLGREANRMTWVYVFAQNHFNKTGEKGELLAVRLGWAKGIQVTSIFALCAGYAMHSADMAYGATRWPRQCEAEKTPSTS